MLSGLRSDDGVHFGNRTNLLELPSPPWREVMFTHNLAVLPLGRDEYAMIGGLQGFVSNVTCRKELRMSRVLAPIQHHAACLQLDRREPNDGSMDTAPSNGIRLSRGRGLPWSSSKWTMPHTIITGDSPSGCVDRRPYYTGFPRLQACQFDGRLALTRAVNGGFLLYARANLRFGAVSGGRFVQVSQSASLERGWAAWQPVHILGVDPQSMDVYFFSVQANPVHSGSLLALFPLTEPPFACIAFAISIDGIRFSRPATLRQSLLGVRQSERGSGLAEATLEWRGEDHPVAGVVRSPTSPAHLLVYLHHAVKGTTIRANATPHVRVYQVTTAEILRYTSKGLQELQLDA